MSRSYAEIAKDGERYVPIYGAEGIYGVNKLAELLVELATKLSEEVGEPKAMNDPNWIEVFKKLNEMRWIE